MDKKYYTYEDLIDMGILPKVKKKSLYVMKSAGGDFPPSILVGRRRLFPKDMLDAWVERKMADIKNG